MKRKIIASANVDFNQDFFCVETVSRGMLGYVDPDFDPYYLSPDVDNATLGATLKSALKASKTVSAAEFQKIFKSGVVQQKAKKNMSLAMEKYGYKTKKEMSKNMNCCWISVFENEIEIKPTDHSSIDGYTGISNEGPEIIHLSLDVSDEELGAALKEGFKRCTSSYK